MIGAFCFANGLETFGDFCPVDDVPERLEIIGALVLIFQVIRVFPDIHAQDDFAFGAGNGLAHERIILVGGGDDFELAAVGHEPRPATAETANAGGFKFGLEVGEGAERAVDGIGEFAGGRAARLGAEDAPEK